MQTSRGKIYEPSDADKRRILFNRAVIDGADAIKKAYYEQQNAPLTEKEQAEWEKYKASPKQEVEK